MNHRLPAQIAALFFSTAAAIAYAQPASVPASAPSTTPAAAPANPDWHQQQHPWPGEHDHHRGHYHWQQRHLAYLKAKLKLTAAQESSWTTFTTALQPDHAMDHGKEKKSWSQERAAMDKLTTPERIDKLHALRKERMEAMDARWTQRENATKTFYSTLTAEQRNVFDTAFAHQRHRHFGHHGDWRSTEASPAKPQ